MEKGEEVDGAAIMSGIGDDVAGSAVVEKSGRRV